mmetsp:Transcript_30591/g.58950  ORF Transcript_30591/g.58950 Transcript_30591/m.58950 type:complete len:80 (-) Transcript_30591:176-415(-)
MRKTGKSAWTASEEHKVPVSDEDVCALKMESTCQNLVVSVKALLICSFDSKLCTLRAFSDWTLVLIIFIMGTVNINFMY